MSTDSRSPRVARALLFVAVGALAGVALVYFADRGAAPGATRRFEIGINGVPMRLARDLDLPPHGWTLQLRFDPPADPAAPALLLELREERTGLTVEVQDQLVRGPEGATLLIPESMGVREGLLAVRARATWGDGAVAEDWRRLRIRRFFGGPPIGDRQIIALDFEVDRDGDGRRDFEQDLERLGLAAAGAPASVSASAATAAATTTAALADRIAARALARVERAYDAEDDPNATALPRDPVAVRFRRSPVTAVADRPFTTRICVGGRDPAHPGSVGHVRFDLGNALRAGEECGGEQTAGLFPGELGRYAESPLYQDVLAPFRAESGGRPFGSVPGDDRLLTGSPDGDRARRDALDRAIDVFGEALGTLIAHETAHALGLVAPGTPPVGLFGGAEGEAFAHENAPGDATDAPPSLMAPGKRFRFEDLAGEGPAGALRFAPLDYAYLRDRIVLKADESEETDAAPVE